MGEAVYEGVISKWLKAKGERVAENEPLLEINTDKVDSEVLSPAAGVLLETLAAEGATVAAGGILAWIGAPGDAIPAAGGGEAQPAQPPAPAQPAAHERPAPRELGFISPVVARIAAEHGVDLARVPGSGQGGRITKKDVLEYVERGEGVRDKGQGISDGEIGQLTTDNVLPLNAIRRAIAEHMVMSRRTSPHVSTIMEVDLSRVTAHRQQNKAAFATSGVNLTFTAYFTAAAVAALKTYPLVNSSWGEQGIVLHRQVNIGMATSLGEEGLIVPVIKNADALSLLGLAQAINDLAGRARAKKLQPDEVKGGTFTITNHGISGSLFATPIINQPQCAILGVGAIQKRAVVISDAALGDSIAIRPMAYISLTFDHRILDGASADNFLAKVVATLQNWGAQP
jgi:2-oxoglutarate dehydrogenase E2 component (dihydrolipoamide succinyltransferase)